MSGQRYDPWRDFELLDEVMDKYAQQQGRGAARNRRWHLQGKKVIWRLVIGSTLFFKRILDIVGASVALLFLWPVFVLTAAAIWLEDPGRVFFHQTRIGRWGKPFTLFKFRSMILDAEKLKASLKTQNESAAGVIFKMKRDPRITKVGRWIRKFSIDELPQLINVLKGDMSLVGPRPPVPVEVAEYSLEERRRLDVIPGITCIWQVSGRSDIDFHGQVRLDVQYIRSQSFLGDLLLLLKTIPAVLLGKGAY